MNEQILGRLVNNDVVFYEVPEFEKIVHRINCHKISQYTLSPTLDKYFIICFSLGNKGLPSRSL